MWANDFRLGSSWCHFCVLRPNALTLVTTARLCHITSAGSGTSPSILRVNRFIRYPDNPVISAFGIRGVLAMSLLLSSDRHEDTARARSVTPILSRIPPRRLQVCGAAAADRVLHDGHHRDTSNDHRRGRRGRGQPARRETPAPARRLLLGGPR